MKQNWTTRWHTIFRLASLVFCCAYPSFSQSSGIARIEVKTKWAGLGPTSESKLSIQSRHCDLFAKGKKLDAALAAQLLRELETSVGVPTTASLGLTESWLNENAERALPKQLHDRPQNEKDLFLNSFRNPEVIAQLLPALLRGGWTDDYPTFEMGITKSDGSLIQVSSQRQNIFMIPLSIEENGRHRVSYNAGLSRAIAAMLPKDFTERDRLTGDRLAEDLSERLVNQIHDELNLLQTRNEIGPELKLLEARYTLKETALNYISSVDVDTPHEHYLRWNAKLQRNDLPSNVIVGISLPYEAKKLKNFDLFLNKIDTLIELTLSVPWLAEYLPKHPSTTLEVRFVTNRSMSERAFTYFVETLKAFGAEDYATKVQSQLPESVFLEVSQQGGWSRWIILPDRTMVLFDFQGDEVLNWRVDDFATRVRFDTKNWHMAKAVIAPTGKIEVR